MRKILLALALLIPALPALGQVAPNISYVDGVWRDGATTYDFVHKFGRNPDVDTATDPEDMIENGGLYGGFAITTSDTVLIVSSSVQDSAGGTGALTYTVEGLDANCRKITVTDTLLGTTADTVSFAMYRVFRTYMNTAGTTGSNVGNITVKTPKDSVLAYVAAGYGQTLQAVYTVPADYEEGFLRRIYATAEKPTGSAGNIFFLFQIRPQNGAWRTLETFGFNSGVESTASLVYDVPISIPACSDMRLRVEEVGQNNSFVSGGFDMWLVK